MTDSPGLFGSYLSQASSSVRKITFCASASARIGCVAAAGWVAAAARTFGSSSVGSNANDPSAAPLYVTFADLPTVLVTILSLADALRNTSGASFRAQPCQKSVIATGPGLVIVAIGSVGTPENFSGNA